MASSDSKPRSLSEVVPPPKQTSDMREIDGVSVVVVLASVKDRTGSNGKYKLTSFTLDDGREFVVAGLRIGETFEQLKDEDYPVIATFTSHPSDFDDSGVWWSVA